MLLNGTVKLFVGLKRHDGAGPTLVQIKPQQDWVPNLSQWVIGHKIDELSPLHKRNTQDLLAVYARISLFDCVYNQHVTVSKCYHSCDLVLRHGHRFCDMLSISGSDVFIDHSQIDSHESAGDLVHRMSALAHAFQV